jgi:hypothetical protein
MHPVMNQAIAAERARELHAYAAAAGRARQLRRSARARRLRRGGPGPALLAAARLLRRPRAA